MKYPVSSLLLAFKQNALRLWAEQNIASLDKNAPIESIVSAVETMAIRSTQPEVYLCQLFLQLPFDDAAAAKNIIQLSSGSENEQRLAALSLAGVLPSDAISIIQAGVTQLNDCISEFNTSQAEFNPTTNYLQYSPPSSNGAYLPPAPLVLQSSQNPATVVAGNDKKRTGEQFSNIANVTLAFVNALGGLVDKVGVLKNGTGAAASSAQQNTSNQNAIASDNNAVKWLLGIFGGLVVVVLGIILYKKYR